jgi:hypothetical protein
MLLLTVGAAIPFSLGLLIPALGSAWWIALFIALGLGYASARLLPAPMSILVGAAATPAAACLVILFKVLSRPDVPAVGDGFVILLAVFAAMGAFAAGLTAFVAAPGTYQRDVGPHSN